MVKIRNMLEVDDEAAVCLEKTVFGQQLQPVLHIVDGFKIAQRGMDDDFSPQGFYLYDRGRQKRVYALFCFHRNLDGDGVVQIQGVFQIAEKAPDIQMGDLMPYVQNSFVPFQDERYNADLYNTETQLPFMTREDAFETVQNALKEMGIEIEASYTGYALDHETMQSQEHHEDMDGNPDRSQNKARWSEEDDCYYFYIRQTFRGLPLYYVYNQVFTDAVEIDTPVQAVVSGEGIEWLSIENVFAVSEEQGGISLADMDSVVKTAADKYNQILGDAAYEVTKAQLYYYVDLASGTGTYDMKPAWGLTMPAMMIFVCAAIAFADSFCEDMEHKYVMQQVIRGNAGAYVLARMLTVFLAAMFSAAAGLFLFANILHFRLAWVEEAAAYVPENKGENLWIKGKGGYG